MKTLVKIFFALFIAVTALNPASAQGKKDKQAAKIAAMKSLIESKDFTFQATYAYPSYGNQRYLTPGYDVRVVQDTVVSYLPFFGVAYTGAGYNNSGDEGIKFTSTDFTYSSEMKKNGMFYVLIKPKNAKNASQLAFNISPSGTADLTVLSNNRERMRFSGNVKEKK